MNSAGSSIYSNTPERPMPALERTRPTKYASNENLEKGCFSRATLYIIIGVLVGTRRSLERQASVSSPHILQPKMTRRRRPSPYTDSRGSNAGSTCAITPAWKNKNGKQIPPVKGPYIHCASPKSTRSATDHRIASFTRSNCYKFTAR